MIELAGLALIFLENLFYQNLCNNQLKLKTTKEKLA